MAIVTLQRILVPLFLVSWGGVLVAADDGASGYFGNLTEDERAGYVSWLSERGSSLYSRYLFLPTATDPANGAAVFWSLLGDEDDVAVATGRESSGGSDGATPTATTALAPTRIQFAVAVRAAGGWVGLGVSAAGGMLGSDLGLYETAKPDVVTDAYVVEERVPIVDDCQHWTLVGVHDDSATGDGGWLIVEMSRPLDTMDPQDIAIVDDADLFAPTRLIAAWGDTPEVGYHGSNVGKNSVKLFGDRSNVDATLGFEELMEVQADGYFEVRESNFTIPAAETTYQEICKTYAELKVEYNLPDTETGTLTFIGGGAVLSPETRQHVHHFLVYGSANSDNCSEASSMLWGWAPGDEDTALPDGVGIPLFGNSSEFRSILIQIHYNNPAKVSGMTDSSGFRLYYTVAPREMEAAWLPLADPFTLLRGTEIESGLTQYSFSCGGDCSSFVMDGDESVTVIAETLHMHQTGVRMTNELIRDGAVVNLGAVDVFEFDQQGAFLVQQRGFQIQPGDAFRTTCYYRDGTSFGLSSQQEMCIAWYLYYPAKRMDFGAFGSFPWTCLHGIDYLPVCQEEMVVTALSSDEQLGRSFGTSPGSCSATVGTQGGDVSTGVEEGDGQDDSGENDGSSAPSFSKTLPSMAVILGTIVNARMRI